MADSQTNETDNPNASADMPDEAKGRRKGGTKGAESLGADEVQANVDAENEQGFRGVKVDPTPDEHYTVAGVTAGKPTPETDADAHADAHHAAMLEGRFPKSQG